VSQKHDSDVARYNFNAHQPILVILAEMLLREYAMDAHLFSHTVSRKWHCFGLLYLRHSSTNFNIFL